MARHLPVARLTNVKVAIGTLVSCSIFHCCERSPPQVQTWAVPRTVVAHLTVARLTIWWKPSRRPGRRPHQGGVADAVGGRPAGPVTALTSRTCTPSSGDRGDDPDPARTSRAGRLIHRDDGGGMRGRVAHLVDGGAEDADDRLVPAELRLRVRRDGRLGPAQPRLMPRIYRALQLPCLVDGRDRPQWLPGRVVPEVDDDAGGRREGLHPQARRARQPDSEAQDTFEVAGHGDLLEQRQAGRQPRRLPAQWCRGSRARGPRAETPFPAAAARGRTGPCGPRRRTGSGAWVPGSRRQIGRAS